MLFSKKLKDLRRKRNLSQQALANIAGMNKMIISKYETGKSSPNIESLGKIAKALNVTADSLVFEDAPDKNRLEFRDAELIEKLREVEELSGEDRKVIKTLIDAMLAKRKIEKVVRQHT